MDMSYQNRNQDNLLNIKELIPEGKIVIFGILIFIFLWIISFIASMACFGKSGSTLEKIMGVLLAIFFGLFYFLFYAFNGNYCR